MTNKTNQTITEITASDKELIIDFISVHWGSPLCVSRGKLYDPANLPGFICIENNKLLGLITYHIQDTDCEIVNLNSLVQNSGLGTKLINKVISRAKENNCNRVWLVTTNDNINGIKFYQKRGFEWAGFHKNAIKESRKLKPEIPEIGHDSIPIKHEIEFEYILK